MCISRSCLRRLLVFSLMTVATMQVCWGAGAPTLTSSDPSSVNVSVISTSPWGTIGINSASTLNTLVVWGGGTLSNTLANGTVLGTPLALPPPVIEQSDSGILQVSTSGLNPYLCWNTTTIGSIDCGSLDPSFAVTAGESDTEIPTASVECPVVWNYTTVFDSTGAQVFAYQFFNRTASIVVQLKSGTYLYNGFYPVISDELASRLVHTSIDGVFQEVGDVGTSLPCWIRSWQGSIPQGSGGGGSSGTIALVAPAWMGNNVNVTVVTRSGIVSLDFLVGYADPTVSRSVEDANIARRVHAVLQMHSE